VISTTQAAEYLDQTLGITVPVFVLSAAVERVEAYEQALVDAGYTEATQTLLQAMAVAIVAAGGAPRAIKSQGAPSGASRSFDNAKDALSALRRSLSSLDTAGVLTDVVGADPAAASLMLVVA
jgi:ABC-type phosphate/phosphonate transport system substrate-binding protein